MDSALLQAKDLTIGYVDKKPHKVVHQQINLTLKRGELTCLLGTNGAGKSTLLKTLGGFQSPLAGEVSIENQNIRSYSQKELAKKLGVVLTDHIATANLTVYELVSFGRYIYTDFFGNINKQDHEVIRYALSVVGIESYAHRSLRELSDGERQKVMIAKAIAQETPLILLDEPTAFLDLPSRVEIMLLLRRLASEDGKTVLLSTHDLDLALHLADKIWIMAKKREMVCGVPEDLALNGVFNSFFDKENLQFDIQTGTFRINSTPKKYVHLDVNESSRFWLQKALHRKGYRVTDHTSPITIEEKNLAFWVKKENRSFLANNIEDILLLLEQ